MPLTVISFGYLHEVPAATVTVDVRGILRDPHIDPALRNLTADDPAVRAKVAHTPGAAALADRLTETARTLAHLSELTGEPVSLAIGCAGGRHRSASLAMTVAERLGAEGHPVTLTHLHLDRPCCPALRMPM